MYLIYINIPRNGQCLAQRAVHSSIFSKTHLHLWNCCKLHMKSKCTVLTSYSYTLSFMMNVEELVTWKLYLEAAKSAITSLYLWQQCNNESKNKWLKFWMTNIVICVGEGKTYFSRIVLFNNANPLSK